MDLVTKPQALRMLARVDALLELLRGQLLAARDVDARKRVMEQVDQALDERWVLMRARDGKPF